LTYRSDCLRWKLSSHEWLFGCLWSSIARFQQSLYPTAPA
jgi:hypothetical protein